jgi:septum formation protein
VKQERALVLASASPRRREILGQLGVAFRIVPSGIDEAMHEGETPDTHVQRLASEKAEEVQKRIAGEGGRPFVLAADTVVVIGGPQAGLSPPDDGRVLGKPRDDDEAEAMLVSLGGRTHRVFTALSLREVGGSYRDDLLLKTEVTFRGLDAATARAYVASGEGRDKAGSYAIQGLGAGLVQSINGSYTNVVGMPAVETLDMLVRAGVLWSWP